MDTNELRRRLDADPENLLLKTRLAIAMVRSGREPPWEIARLVYPGSSYLKVKFADGGPIHLGAWGGDDVISTACGRSVKRPFSTRESPSLIKNVIGACKVCKDSIRYRYLNGSAIWGNGLSYIPEAWRARYGWEREKFDQPIRLTRPPKFQYRRCGKYWLPSHDPVVQYPLFQNN